MEIEEGDVLEVFEGSPFTVNIELYTEDGQRATGESGRLLQISAGIRSASPKLTKRRTDTEETQMPFGFEVISYPLMERAFESHGPRSAASLAVAKSGFAQADSPVPEGQPGSGGGSDGTGLGRDTPSYLDGQSDEQKEGFFGPVASQRTKAGEATFQNLMLAPPQMSEVQKHKAAWVVGRGLLTSTPESSTDGRVNDEIHDGDPLGKDSVENRSLRAGEYVLAVKDRTSPPFLGQMLPTCFALLHVIPKKVGGSASRMAGHNPGNK